MTWPPDAELELRRARDPDSPGIVALVGRCFAEYAGCVLDVNREEPGLLTPTTSFPRFWVLTHDDRVFGSIACAEHDVQIRSASARPTEEPRPSASGRAEPCEARPSRLRREAAMGEPGVELKKCYLHPAVRGRGWASRLVDLVESFARERGRPLVELWSDTRFVTAHAVYQHLGYTPTGAERALHDLSDTREFHFVKRLQVAEASRHS